MTVRLTWIGQAGFLIRTQATSLALDPFLSDHPDRRYPSPVGPGDLAGTELVLVSHQHLDHLDAPALAALLELDDRARVVVPAPVVAGRPMYGAPVYGAPVYGAPVYGAPVYVQDPFWYPPVSIGLGFSFGRSWGGGRHHGGTPKDEAAGVVPSDPRPGEEGYSEEHLVILGTLRRSLAADPQRWTTIAASSPPEST